LLVRKTQQCDQRHQTHAPRHGQAFLTERPTVKGPRAKRICVPTASLAQDMRADLRIFAKW
jgi:hypothetical protein